MQDTSDSQTPARTGPKLHAASLARILFEWCGRERRRVLSSWRAQVLLNRTFPAASSRGVSNARIAQIIRELLRKGQLESIEGVHGVYLVNVPFSDTIQITDEHILQEAHPYAAFSFLTALAHHGLTDLIPNRLYVTSFGQADSRRFPLGTTPEEWIDLSLPKPSFPKQIRAASVEWTRSNPGNEFGIVIGLSAGLPIYVTDRERTLLDALRAPQKCQGVSVVLRAWRTVREQVDLDRLTVYTDRLASPVMCQRVGFLLEELGLHHARLKDWQENLQRGGSIKLVAAAPYAPTFSARWNLSINVPSHVIEELQSE